MLTHDETVQRRSNSPSFLSRVDFLVSSQRLGRIRFLGLLSFWCSALILSVFALDVITAPEDAETASTVLTLLRFTAMIPAMVSLLNLFLLKKRRLNDFNSSGWWMIFVIVPVINLIVFAFLFLKSGTKGINKFGDVTMRPTKFDYALILSLPLLIAFILLFDIDIFSRGTR